MTIPIDPHVAPIQSRLRGEDPEIDTMNEPDHVGPVQQSDLFYGSKDFVGFCPDFTDT